MQKSYLEKVWYDVHQEDEEEEEREDLKIRECRKQQL